MQNVLAKGGPAPCQVCSIAQSKEVLRIRWGMSQDRESNPRGPLTKDKKIWAKINKLKPTESTMKSSLEKHHNGKVLMVSARPTDGW